MVKKRIVIPARYIMTVPQKGTRAIRNPKTGIFMGRTAATGRNDDHTRERMLRRDYDANKDGRIGKGEHGGNLLGRQVAVKASGRSRAYVREL